MENAQRWNERAQKNTYELCPFSQNYIVTHLRTHTDGWRVQSTAQQSIDWN